MLGAQHTAEDVDSEDSLSFLTNKILDGSGVHDPHVVDEDIHCAEFKDCSRGNRSPVALRSHIQLLENGGLAEFSRQLLAVILENAGNHDPSAFLYKKSDHCSANTARAVCDYRYLATNPTHKHLL